MLTRRFEEALVYANRLHARQKRKGTKIPYVAHLLSAAALVLEAGGDEDEVIAALLHDAAEDQGGEYTLDVIQDRFGERVAEIVAACSDSYSYPKPPWRKRKEAYLAHLNEASPSVLRVSLADKLHNARAIQLDLLQDGDRIWRRFNGGKHGSLWYYRALVDIFQKRFPHPLTDELDRIVTQIEALS